MRQLLTESLMLAGLGGGLGLILAFAGTDVLVRLAPAGTPLLDQVSVDGRILAFAMLGTMLTGLLFGILPATSAARTQPASTLREGGRSGSGGNSPRIRNALVVSQVALALTLLVVDTVLSRQGRVPTGGMT